MDMIRIARGQGFQLSIGEYTISVQIGHENYCSRRDYSKFGPETEFIIESPDCEIAIWLTDKQYAKWVTKRIVKKVLKETINDDVMGWVTPLQVGQIIAWMTKQAKKQKPA
jgi:hypothetical protein